MKIAIFNDNRLGIVAGQKVSDVTTTADWDQTNPHESLVRLMENFDSLKDT
ncbi:hypothetical protein [Aeribacillus pallidus]|nr:hypothetical protein [Aeribacillus pallidus]